jgi:hypothetical protein
MVSEQEAQRAIDYVRDKAPEYAKAKAERVYIENALKSVKAKQMSESDKKTLGDREIDAYMSIEYETMLKGLREAVAIEEEIKWRMEAAKLRFEHWKTEQFNNRVEARALG